MLSEESRATLMVGLWLLSAIVLAALFISAAAQGDLTPGHIALALILLGLAVAGTLLLVNLKDRETEQGKAKRQRIDNMLSDLSDEELLELKQRLSDVDINDDTILDYVGDDGEMALRSSSPRAGE